MILSRLSVRPGASRAARRFSSRASGDSSETIPFGGRLLLLAGVGAVASYNAFSADQEAPPAKPGKKRVVVLGTGWAATAFLKHIDTSQFDVVCVSPRNYFLMTPLLPSVTVGTVETRTVVEPIRKLVGTEMHFLEAECVKIDPKAKSLLCKLPLSQNEGRTPAGGAVVPVVKKSGWGSKKAAPAPEETGVTVASSSRTVKDSARTRPTFNLDYDVLVMSIGCDNQDFNTPGVKEHAHFLKELPDAQRIRHAISDCFESAALPNISEEERKRLLHFVVVGGGPTGIEYAAELADLLKDDMKRYFGPLATEESKITVIEALDNVLSMMDKRIQTETEKHLSTQGITIMANTFVKGVGQKEVLIQKKGSKEVERIPCAVVVWATGIKPRPLAQEFRKAIGTDVQTNFRGILTDAYMAVKGAEDVYAAGDCATIEQPKLLANLEALFKDALRSSAGGVSLDDLRVFLNNKSKQFPQLEFLVDSLEKNFSAADTNKDGTLDLQEFRTMLERIDNKVRALPATAQVANQQGRYLANLMNKTNGSPATHPGQKPFEYRHLGSLAYIGGDSAVADFSGVEKVLGLIDLGPMSGWGTWLMWRGFYLSEMFTLRTKMLLASDWVRSHVFGRDISRY